VLVKRHKVLQILINLICNAKEAMTQDGAHDKRMVIQVSPQSSDRVRIRVSDNGVGIAANNLHNIFNHGFTTKPDGYGFGLHSAVNAAKEMGGSLSAHSDGEGKGAAFFVLELPLARMREALSSTARVLGLSHSSTAAAGSPTIVWAYA
jgi:C4-dicarboxylate-specific signal transduction histidine kinase